MPSRVYDVYSSRDRSPVDEAVAHQQMDEAAERRRAHVEELYERGRERARDAAERAHDAAEQSRHKVDELQERARDSADHAGDRARKSAEYARDRVNDAGEYAREQVGRAAGHARERVEDLGSHARERLEEIGEHARARMEDAKERMKESLGATRGHVQDTWHSNTEAAKAVAEKEQCLSLPATRLCARYVIWAMLPLLALALLLVVRRRNPERWKAGMKKLQTQRAALGGKMLSAKDHAVETLREGEREIERKHDEQQQRLSTKKDK